MRRLTFLLVGLLLVVAACVPKVEPVTDRDGDVVTITVAAEAALYSATLHAFNATTDDERCVPMNVTDVACTIGDIPAGQAATVSVVGEPGEVECIAFGFSDPSLAITSYRPYFCDHSGGI